MKTVSKLAAAAALCVAAGAHAQTAAPLKVGFMLPYTGTYAALGNMIENGFRLYVQEQGGKLGGRAIEFVKVDDKSAYAAVVEMAQKESIFIGSSGGAAAAGARRVAESLPEDALVVTLFPDSGERSLSKLNKTWMRDKGLLD